MVYSFFGAIVISFSLTIIRDSDIFISYPARIEAFFIIFPASTFSPVRAVDRFFVVFSAFTKSLP
jgi:hypothetical protein